MHSTTFDGSTQGSYYYVELGSTTGSSYLVVCKLYPGVDNVVFGHTQSEKWECK